MKFATTFIASDLIAFGNKWVHHYGYEGMIEYITQNPDWDIHDVSSVPPVAYLSYFCRLSLNPQLHAQWPLSKAALSAHGQFINYLYTQVTDERMRKNGMGQITPVSKCPRPEVTISTCYHVNPRAIDDELKMLISKNSSRADASFEMHNPGQQASRMLMAYSILCDHLTLNGLILERQYRNAVLILASVLAEELWCDYEV